MDEESIYQCMLEIHDYDEKKITYRWVSELLGVSERTLYRHMTDELKQIKKELNEKL